MKPEIQELLTRAKGTLDEARLLAEAGYHSGVVSRSYYAMFYSALAMLQSQGVVTKTHPGTIGKFGDIFAKTGLVDRKFGRSLNEAFELRMGADYGVQASRSTSPEAASGQLERATEFVTMADGFLMRCG